MGYETVSAITENIEAALRAAGLGVTRKALDLARALPAGMLPLAQVLYDGEAFEDPFGERPGYAEARFTIRVLLAEPDDASAATEEQRLGHAAREAVTPDVLNGGALSTERPVVAVRIPGFGVEGGGGLSRISMDVSVRYRES